MTTAIRASIVTWVFLALGLFVESSCPAAESKLALARKVRAILSENCFHCHGPDSNTREADLRLDQQHPLFADRDGYAVVEPGSLANSELFNRITSDDEDLRMPPVDSNLTLSEEDIRTVGKWIESGATWVAHWAYDPITRPEVPMRTPMRSDRLRHEYEGPQNPIDWFVLERLSSERLTPSAPADKRRLLRRVSLDLIGVPPTDDEVENFLSDHSADSYDRVVNRLLSSPKYGERMVWEWLDAARYADSSGFQGDPERTMWPWRDWVVNALNSNMPFDQFTIEQLAGDLLPNATQAQRIATGFNRNHMHNGEGGRIAEETRVENVFDRIETTATVWMGLTFTCARCHDHKYDPFTQKEYYELAAFFNNTTENGGGRGGQNAPAIEYRTARDAETIANAEFRLRLASRELREIERNRFLQVNEDESVSDEVREALKRMPSDRDNTATNTLIEHFQETQPNYVANLKAHQNARHELDRIVDRLPKVMVMDDRDQPRDTFILARGLYNKPGAQVSTGVPAALPPMVASWSSSGDHDRLALAAWLVDNEHPLTSRVTVNRIWQSFFGRGLVASTENFGVQGEEPTHPELLDWLASEFMESGWNVKRLQRLIVTSATYRQSSQVDSDTLQRDPKNVYFARGPRFRMPSWMFRDQALAISGLLVATMGGPSVKPYQPAGIWSEATFGKKKYEQDRGAKLYRRSVYTFWRRIVGPPMFFDASKRQTCEVKTSLTNTPLHALSTLNDVTYVEAARALAQRVMLAQESPRDRIQSAFRSVTTRLPSAVELNRLTTRFAGLRREFASERSETRELLAVGASHRDETLDDADHAAMTVICLLLLNLDETLTKE